MLGAKRLAALVVVATLLVGLSGPTRAQTAKPLSEANLVKLIELQISDEEIVAKVERGGIAFPADGAAVDRLKKAGASPAVLAAVEKAAKASRPTAGRRAVSYQDVLNLLELNVSEEEILKRVEHTIFTLDDRQVAELKKAGASPKLLAAMQKNRSAVGKASDVSDFAIILDCSGSMRERTKDGPSKMEAAKEVVTRLIHDIPNGLGLTFLVYGHDAGLKCRAVKVVRPLGELDDAAKAELKHFIARLQPVGHTPIELALRTAGRELAKSKGLCELVLITDGMETCHGDPARAAEELAQTLNLRSGVNIVGFDVQPEEREAVKKIARAGKGKYYDAQTAKDLAEGLRPLVLAEAAEDEEPAGELDPTVKALVEGLTDKDGTVRARSAESLQKLGAKAKGAVPALVKRVADDLWPGGPFLPNDGGKNAALAALKELAPDKVEKALLKAAKSKTSGVRTWATEALVEWAKDDRSAGKKEQRNEKAKADSEGLEGEELPAVVRAMVEGMTDSDGTVRAQSAESLRKLGAKAKGAVPALIKRVADDRWPGGPFLPNDGGKNAALAALKELAPDKVEEALLKALKSKNKDVKAWATTELGRLKDKD
jgi:hypothetical protein